MEYDKIKQLIEDMGNSKLTSLDIEFPDGTKISAKKEETSLIKQATSNTAPVDDAEKTTVELAKEDVDAKIVKSPMVGTFYMKPSPTSEAYVEMGKQIKKGDVLCIIEAMKLMNEIESEYDGEIEKIFVKDGEPVEYGQKLFLIK